MGRYSKMLGALLGGGIPAAVIAVGDAAGWSVSAALSAAIVGLCATVATYLVPPNAPADGQR